MKRARLISILGLGPEGEAPHYQEVVYQYEGAQSAPTPLVDRALMSFFKLAGLFMIGTPQVKKRWIDSGLFANLIGRDVFAFRQAPPGEADLERWEMFSIFTDALSLETIGEAGESEPPDGFIIDITHGFRIQPAFLMSALAFAFSEWARQGISPPPVRIVYGAFEARHSNNGIAPIWDLTEYLTVSRWNGALDAFLRYGRADELEVLSRDSSAISIRAAVEAGEKGPAMAVHAFLRRLGTQARRVADDLALVRTSDLLTKSVPLLLELLDHQDCLTWLERLPVLKGGVELLKERLRPLAVESVVDRDGIVAQSQLADLYLLLQRFSEAAVTIREGLITQYALEHDYLQGLINPPGTKECPSGRSNIERRWSNDVVLKKLKLKDPIWPETIRQNIALSRNFQQARNDIEHGGFNDSPSDSASLRGLLSVAAADFRRLACLTNKSEPEVARESCFINLSNHPISSWSLPQLESAEGRSFGKPFDLPGGMPHVPAEATVDDIVALADDVVARVERTGARAAFVATDQTLTFAIVSRLQQRGIVCYNTISPRHAQERVLSDGAVEKTSRFVFSGWRRYPSL